MTAWHGGLRREWTASRFITEVGHFYARNGVGIGRGGYVQSKARDRSLGGVVRGDLVTGILPVLGRSSELGFNVFDVMHRGLHEKQISNVFRWILDSQGSHRMGGTFTRIFMDEVNRARPTEEPFPCATATRFGGR